MAYRKRTSPIIKRCPTCLSEYETFHNGRKYCGQACNQTSWRRRNGISQAKVKETLPVVFAQEAVPVVVAQPEKSSMKGQITSATIGSAGTQLIKHLINDAPFQERVLIQLEKLSNQVQEIASSTTKSEDLEDVVNALKKAHPELGMYLSEEVSLRKQREEREFWKQQSQEARDRYAKALAKLTPPKKRK